MNHWSVTVEASAPGRVTEDQADAVASSLSAHQATVSLNGTEEVGHVGAQFDVQARTPGAAITAGIKAFTDALAAAGVAGTLHAAEVITYEELDRRLSKPTVPPLVGMAEIAEILGVSRQRAHQVAERDDFPAPVQELAAGNVYARASVEAFNGRWARRAGRPPKASAA